MGAAKPAIARVASLALLAASIVAPGAARAAGQPRAPEAPAQREYRLEVGGKSGPLLGVEAVRVITSPGTPKARAWPGIVVRAATGLPAPFYDWVRGGLGGAGEPLAATLTERDERGVVLSRVQVRDAIVSEVAFPALDAASRAPAFMAVKARAAFAQEPPGAAAPARAASPRPESRWRASGFRFVLGPLDCREIAHVDAFTVAPGAPAQLAIAMRGTSAASFAKWLSVPGPHRLPKGRLELLASDGRTVLARLELHEVTVGDFRSTPRAPGGGGGPSGNGEARLSVQRVAFTYSPAITR